MIPEILARTTAAALEQAIFMLESLGVDEGRRHRDLDFISGLIVAEAVTMDAAPALGRQHAYGVVYQACRTSLEGGLRLRRRSGCGPGDPIGSRQCRGDPRRLRPVEL